MKENQNTWLEIQRGWNEIRVVVYQFYVVACALYDTLGTLTWKHSITQLKDFPQSENYRLQVQSTKWTIIPKKTPYTWEGSVTSYRNVHLGSMVIRDVGSTEVKVIVKGVDLNEYVRSVINPNAKPSMKARYESENRRLDLLIDAMRNG